MPAGEREREIDAHTRRFVNARARRERERERGAGHLLERIFVLIKERRENIHTQRERERKREKNSFK